MEAPPPAAVTGPAASREVEGSDGVRILVIPPSLRSVPSIVPEGFAWLINGSWGLVGGPAGACLATTMVRPWSSTSKEPGDDKCSFDEDANNVVGALLESARMTLGFGVLVCGIFLPGRECMDVS